MDGFMAQLRAAERACPPQDPGCVSGNAAPDVMGYHDEHEIPNYWAYAQNFVLQDRMFAPTYGWSLPVHLWLVSGWSAKCPQPRDAA